MGRGTHNAPGEPIARTLQLDDRSRLSLPRAVVEVTPWLDVTSPPPCRLALGVRGGLALLPEEKLARDRNLLDRIADMGLTRSRSGTPVGDFSRLMAMTWPVQPDAQLRLTVPEEARKLGLLPGPGHQVTVWAFSGLVEIWIPEAWLAYCRQQAARPDLEQLASDLLPGR